MKIELKYPIMGVIVAEMIMFFGQIIVGLGIHIINLLIIIFLIMFSKINEKEKYLLQSLTLLIILRMVNLSMPQFFTTTLIQYPLVYGVMFIPIYNLTRSQGISLKELGINLKKLWLYIPIGLIIGVIMAIFEGYIINPSPLINTVRLSDIILISIIMFVFIGTVEELIFRGILQTRFVKVFGNRWGIVLSGSSFGIMHSSYGVINEILFVTIFGIFLSYLFYRTKNVIFTTMIHGTTNVILFSGILGTILR
jgi:membrane protease YdiL (CAAX protease family)